ncbi:pyrroloquinoline quinone biosynthesis peptide chaperone PqqD [Acuticoccus sediminis]|uniref:Pyrroloquinoline quinone biosynthesis peptide chaperone PqqD n=1 Tax=Acuticoccus sediminis TaxID=2184697 RepID=A0A8B2NK41_9HYPH|nr:PqqD family peptide modification chaperone [Acuticoccus sediminis]RAH99994.1 pyrroloquinoline quinone biosynthesis peptide chaperone PqqD [Acuticoccus sediminis]
MTPLSASDILVRPTWARLKHCEIRGQWVLLVPEQVLYPCPTTVEVLERLAAPTRYGAVIDALADEYDAPVDVIEADLSPLVMGLVEQGYVRRVDA